MAIKENDKNRNDLAKLFKGVGAEIGVERALFSRNIAKTATKLYCIDPWKAGSLYGFRDYVTQTRLDDFLKEAKQRVKKYNNCVFIRKSSMEAVKDFADESLDFVYIDANHDYEHTKEDIKEWSKKVKRGGIVSGHDYIDKQSQVYTFGVIKAVNELQVDLTIWKGDKTPSWSYIK